MVIMLAVSIMSILMEVTSIQGLTSYMQGVDDLCVGGLLKIQLWSPLMSNARHSNYNKLMPTDGNLLHTSGLS